MTENDLLLISWINDFLFCPTSIYFHSIYDGLNKFKYQDTPQIRGTAIHKSIESGAYSTRKDILTNVDIVNMEYGIVGKIDIYDIKASLLVERKKKIKTVYDGYIFQLYAQYFCLIEMGYSVQKMKLYSMDDNKNYPIALPKDDSSMKQKFFDTIKAMREFDIYNYIQNNIAKCQNCIYNPLCDRALDNCV